MNMNTMMRLLWLSFNFCFCSTLAAAVMKWDKEATEATIKNHAAEHLKHAPGRKGGGGHTGVEINYVLCDTA